tara:strand:+ start:2252 stop:2716 length:465 start_codon:yes stop_codon:yes gene_type:complete
MKIISKSETETKELAIKFLKKISFPLIIGFSGELGVGKTQFIRNMIQTFDKDERVKSPTFGIAEEYLFKEAKIVHADLYRIKKDERDYIDFNSYYEDNFLILIEWIENDSRLFSYSDILIDMRLCKNNIDRKILFSGKSTRGKKILQEFQNTKI